MAHDKPKPGRRLLVSPVDGVERNIEQEMALNSLAASVFREGGARMFLDYLRSITLNRIGGPALSDAELRYLEGQRGLFGIVQKRITLGQKGPTHAVAPEKPTHD